MTKIVNLVGLNAQRRLLRHYNPRRELQYFSHSNAPWRNLKDIKQNNQHLKDSKHRQSLQDPVATMEHHSREWHVTLFKKKILGLTETVECLLRYPWTLYTSSFPHVTMSVVTFELRVYLRTLNFEKISEYSQTISRGYGVTNTGYYDQIHACYTLHWHSICDNRNPSTHMFTALTAGSRRSNSMIFAAT